MRCTNLLEHDHKIILRALNVLQEIAIRVEKGEWVDSRDVEAILRFLRRFEDEYHQAKEESALFPELRRSAAVENKELKHMLFEHEQERSLVEGLEESLKTRKGKEFVFYANRLTALLRNHIYKEDHILFDIVEKSLSEDQDHAVVTAFAEFERDFKAGQGLTLLGDLDRLESEYLKRRSA
jgi:hemerythrin-like domain-containing protein